jgi:uncharacterized cupin superfamily protein
MMPKLDLSKVPVRTGTIYPPPFDAEVAGRSSMRLGDAGGLKQFGVNIVILAPGAKSSLRHWHENEDEFVMITMGECTMVTDAGPEIMRVGDCAAFPAGSPDGHHFINHTDQEARFLVVGTKAKAEVAHYSDVDFLIHQGGGVNRMTYRDGTDWTGPR